MQKKIYITNFSGLGNRLEALVLAGMIQDHFGHSIHLDWPEKGSLQIAGTIAGRMPPWKRLFSTARSFQWGRLSAALNNALDEKYYTYAVRSAFIADRYAAYPLPRRTLSLTAELSLP